MIPPCLFCILGAYASHDSRPAHLIKKTTESMPKTDTHTLIKYVILLLAFISGFAIMTIELLGGRLLAPWFGSSIYIWGSIITVFMLSLSVGYLLGGRWSLNNPNLLRHGLFFVLSSITLLPVILFGNAVMESVFVVVTDPRYGSLLVSAILFFVPTAILGMIAPYSIRLLVENEQHSGEIAGLLYFVSTLGSALGTLVTSFYLVLIFEINQVLLTVSVVLIVSGILAMLSFKFLADTVND